MAKLTTEELFAKYRQNLVGAGEQIRIGAERTEKSQTANAIKAKQRMVDNLIKALNNGDWEKGLQKAGDEKWLKNLIEKGISKIGAGIDANEEEIKQKLAIVNQVGDEIKNAVKDMPKGSLDDSVARSRKAMETAKKKWGKM